MNAVTLDLPEFAYRNGDQRPVFTSTTCDVQARVGERLVNVWLTDMGADHDLNLDAAEARSLAAALLAAADASEVA